MKATKSVFTCVLILVLLISVIGHSTPGNAAETYPNRNITLIVPIAPGGSNDRMARGIAQYLGPQLGTNIVVENRAGANMQVGFEQLMRSPADGYTMIIGGNQPYLSTTILRQNAPYSVDDFDIMAIPNNDAVCVTALTDSSFNTLEDVINFIKENPGQLRIGLAHGNGPQLQWHLIARTLGLQDGVDYREVSYNGSEYRQALLGGHVDINLSGSLANLGLPSIKLLAIASDESKPAWEGVRSINECLAPFGESVRYINILRIVAFPGGFKAQHPERWEIMKNALAAVFRNDEYIENLERTGEASIFVEDPFTDVQQIIRDYHEILVDLIDGA